MVERDYPRGDTFRQKRKIQRKVRACVRHINKKMRADIFGDRFWIEISGQEIRPWSDNSGWHAWFKIAFHDNEQPDRDFEKWYWGRSVLYSGLFAGGDHMDTDLNDFIVKSDFWEKYRAQH